MSHWVRASNIPASTEARKIRAGFYIDPKTEPELAQWYLSLPYREGSNIIKEIITRAIAEQTLTPTVGARIVNSDDPVLDSPAAPQRPTKAANPHPVPAKTPGVIPIQNVAKPPAPGVELQQEGLASSTKEPTDSTSQFDPDAMSWLMEMAEQT